MCWDGIYVLDKGNFIFEWKNYIQCVGNYYPFIAILNMMYVCYTASDNVKNETIN